ncbi:flagellar biosynthesis anti-sigma factor FlgM [Pluralibacter gergoviae]|uniref:flagellar biosynthesis anti-sigma factor FlgM n=1 Tax=Pluralibacter gergoviae TaxID=61647 RepID=UPI00065199E5|nr:flagellar biosynthesis anti-sigma factor FlgM [Pluralibacter gergoviae]KMK19918.1 flagellar biosynthesis anti-sigma factor FlgM [Pluralibacter gergoviae]
MKITSTQYGLNAAINRASGAEQTRTAAQEGAAVNRSAAIDPALGEAQSLLSALPEIDMARIAEVREAIAGGKIAVNLDALTGAMQKYFQGRS